MTDDDARAHEKAMIGPNGERLLGLETRRERAAPSGHKPSRKERLTEFTRRDKGRGPDPLDRTAQAIPGTVDYVKLDAPNPLEVVESKVMWAIVARDTDGRGPWTHALVGENIRATSFASRGRAEGIMGWLRRTAAGRHARGVRGASAPVAGSADLAPLRARLDLPFVFRLRLTLGFGGEVR